MNNELIEIYNRLKTNLIQSPASFDLLHEMIIHPKVATLNELIKYDMEKVTVNDGTELTKSVMKAVTEVCHVSPEEIFSSCRKREFNDARIIYLTFLRMGTTWSLEKLSKHLNRHHATMIHGLKTFVSLVDTDPRFKKKVLQIIELLNNQKIYTFDQLLTTNKWKYERINGNLERGARIASKTRLLTPKETKRQQQIHTANA
jgi:hypothetical protein